MSRTPVKRRALALCLLVTACGARSSLQDLGAGAGVAGGGPGAGGGGQSTLPRCSLGPAQPPKPLLSFPEGNTDAPGMVVLDGGGAERPARVAYSAISEDANFWHPELRIGELSIGPDWPDGATITRQPTLFGFDAHAWGLLVGGPGDTVALAYYHGDEANPNVKAELKFHAVDTGSWTFGPEVGIDPAGALVYGLTRGEGSYAVSWRADVEGTGDSVARIGILDDGGQLLGPTLDVNAPEPYPGRSADVAWSGAEYLVATTFDGCEGQPAGCVDRSLVVKRVDPRGVLTNTTAIPALDGLVPSRPTVAAANGHVWVAWLEAAAEDAPRTVRLAPLDAEGALASTPLTLAAKTQPILRLGVLVSELGVTVVYPEAGDTTRPQTEPGYARLVLHHVPAPDEAAQPAQVLPIPAIANGPRVALVALDHPRGVLVSWGAQSAAEGKNVTWLSRFDCQ